MADRIANWAIKVLQLKKGYFYYQRSRFWTKLYAYALVQRLDGVGDCFHCCTAGGWQHVADFSSGWINMSIMSIIPPPDQGSTQEYFAHIAAQRYHYHYHLVSYLNVWWNELVGEEFA